MVFFPRDVFDEIWNLTESVPEKISYLLLQRQQGNNRSRRIILHRNDMWELNVKYLM